MSDNWINKVSSHIQEQDNNHRKPDKDIVKNLIDAMAEYALEAAWNDSDIIDALVGCGITQADFERSGYGEFVRSYFEEEEENVIGTDSVSELTDKMVEQDVHLFTCIADNGYSFFVRGVDQEDAERTGFDWYSKNIFEPGDFICRKTILEDIKTTISSPVLETEAYSHIKPGLKMSLDEQIQAAENRVGGSMNEKDSPNLQR